MLGVLITTEGKNEITNLEEALEIVTVDLRKDVSLKADNAYKLKKNREVLKKRNFKNHILKYANRINQ